MERQPRVMEQGEVGHIMAQLLLAANLDTGH